MAQTVQAVSNPNFTVQPLSTVAGTIVSRRRLKVPVNLSTTYGPSQGNYQSTAQFDISDNESFIDLSKLFLCCDFTFTGDNMPDGFAPSFDQSTQSLIGKLTIGSSQGLKIEEIYNYSTLFCSLTSIAQTSQHKEMSLLDHSTFDKESFNSLSLNNYLDSQWTVVADSIITANKTVRLQIRLHQSSLLSKIRFLPLFLFRNGIRFEIEFENVYKTFVYDVMSPTDYYRITFTDIPTQTINPNFLIGPSFTWQNGQKTNLITGIDAVQTIKSLYESLAADKKLTPNVIGNGIVQRLCQYYPAHNGLNLKNLAGTGGKYYNTSAVLYVNNNSWQQIEQALRQYTDLSSTNFKQTSEWKKALLIPIKVVHKKTGQIIWHGTAMQHQAWYHTPQEDARIGTQIQHVQNYNVKITNLYANTTSLFNSYVALEASTYSTDPYPLVPHLKKAEYLTRIDFSSIHKDTLVKNVPLLQNLAVNSVVRVHTKIGRIYKTVKQKNIASGFFGGLYSILGYTPDTLYYFNGINGQYKTDDGNYLFLSQELIDLADKHILIAEVKSKVADIWENWVTLQPSPSQFKIQDASYRMNLNTIFTAPKASVTSSKWWSTIASEATTSRGITAVGASLTAVQTNDAKGSLGLGFNAIFNFKSGDRTITDIVTDASSNVTIIFTPPLSAAWTDGPATVDVKLARYNVEDKGMYVLHGDLDDANRKILVYSFEDGYEDYRVTNVKLNIDSADTYNISCDLEHLYSSFDLQTNDQIKFYGSDFSIVEMDISSYTATSKTDANKQLHALRNSTNPATGAFVHVVSENNDFYVHDSTVSIGEHPFIENLQKYWILHLMNSTEEHPFLKKSNDTQYKMDEVWSSWASMHKELDILLDLNSIIPVGENCDYINKNKSITNAKLVEFIALGQQKEITWDYKLENLEMLLDIVKPSSEDFLKFQQAFQKPSGIPYVFKRFVHVIRTISANNSGQVQLNLPVAVRSLTGIFLVLQDPICKLAGSDATRKFFPMTSSFMRRGLSRAEIIVGGQITPVYPLWFRVDGKEIADAIDQKGTLYGNEHIPELENFYAASSSNSFNPSFKRTSLQKTRNYGLCGLFNQGETRSQTYEHPLDSSKLIACPSYVDSSAFVLGFSLAKDDINTFATGIDSSQSGAITLNLYFKDADSGQYIGRDIDCHIWLTCDAVFTVQNDANLVRW